MSGLVTAVDGTAAQAAEPPRRLRRLDWRAGARAPRPIGIVALVFLYWGVARISYALEFAGPVAAIAWLPVGVSIAFLYRYGLRYWPGVLAGDLLVNDYSALPLGSAVGQTCGNLLEVVIATVLLTRLVPRGDPLGSVGGLGRLLIAMAAGTAVSAIVGPAVLLAGDVLRAEQLPRVMRTWWLGDFCGTLIVLPLALAWTHPLRGWRAALVLETVAVLLAVTALSAFGLRRDEILIYVVFPALIWAALRLGARGATLAVALASGLAVWETTRRVGPFAFESIQDSILATQLYISVAALSALSIAAVVAERETLARRLTASRARLVGTSARERRRVERDLHDGAQQRLIALALRLGLAADRAAEDPGTAVASLRAAEAELTTAIEELRELAHGIHPSSLAEHGLAHALRRLTAHSAVPLRLLEVPAVRLDPTAELTAYFVASEAVTNAYKHAGATSISVAARNEGNGLRLEIADDGRGGANEAAGSGLQGLRDRVEAVGGSFAVESPSACGTRIVALIPDVPST